MDDNVKKNNDHSEDLNLEEVLAPIVEKAVASAVPKIEEKAKEEKVRPLQLTPMHKSGLKILLLMLTGKLLMESEPI